jgi:hypothetical protein
VPRSRTVFPLTGSLPPEAFLQNDGRRCPARPARRIVAFMRWILIRPRATPRPWTSGPSSRTVKSAPMPQMVVAPSRSCAQLATIQHLVMARDLGFDE